MIYLLKQNHFRFDFNYIYLIIALFLYYGLNLFDVIVDYREDFIIFSYMCFLNLTVFS